MKRDRNYILSFKVIIFLSLIIAVIVGIYSLAFTRYYQDYERKTIGQENIRTLHSIETSIDTVINNADEYSKMILADDDVQKQMRRGDLFENLSAQSEISRKIYTVYQFSDYIEAIWLMDQMGQRLTVGSAGFLAEDEEYPFEELRKPYGEYQIFLNTEGSRKVLSLVRSYNDLEVFGSLGIIGVDISYSVFDSLVSDVIGETDGQFLIFNEKDELLYSEGELLSSSQRETVPEGLSQGKELAKTVQIGNEYYVLGGIENSSGWKLFRYIPVMRENSENTMAQYIIFSIVSIGALILLFAAAFSRLLTHPIQELLLCMKGRGGDTPVKTSRRPVLNEFKILFSGYNDMVEQIQRLLQSTIDKQRRIRQVELNEIQEQMKPHFLYNTLDSIQALAMIGDSQKVCTVVESLGDFYRRSVSGGRELLTLKEEFQIASDYARIMKIRFENAFSYTEHLEEDCQDFLIPKLTLQPLVENSFQHGVRSKEQFGEIAVEAKLEKGRLHLKISDNGDGVPDEVLEELSSAREPERGKSLGLRGTIERLRLLYEEEVSSEIKNRQGSEIHLYIGLTGIKEKAHEQDESDDRR